MPDFLFHSIFQSLVWQSSAQATTDGAPLLFSHIGRRTDLALPIYFGAQFAINGVPLEGKIALLPASSDWSKSHYHSHPSFQDLDLLIVRLADKPVFTASGRPIPLCVLRYPDADYLAALQSDLTTKANFPLSEDNCFLYNTFLRGQNNTSIPWQKRILEKRLECKRQSILRLLELTNGNWEHAFYITLAHNFGFHTNSLAFEQLALSTPLSYLLKHRNSLFQLSALLLGQAGFLPTDTPTLSIPSTPTDTPNAPHKNTPSKPSPLSKDEDYARLVAEYRFLQKKFSLTPIDPSLWQYGRLRPQNFPHVRIRQFAQWLHQSEFFFSRMLDARTKADCMRLFQLSAPPFIGTSSQHILLINSVIPYQYAYRIYRKQPDALDAAFDLLSLLPSEDNRIIRSFQLVGQTSRHAADSQSLIHLFQHHCQPESCIHCEVAHHIFSLPTPLSL